MNKELLTPWQRFMASVFDWQYARIWVRWGETGRYYFTVRVYADGTIPLTWVGYREAIPPNPAERFPGLQISASAPARLTDFPHVWLTQEPL